MSKMSEAVASAMLEHRDLMKQALGAHYDQHAERFRIQWRRVVSEGRDILKELPKSVAKARAQNGPLTAMAIVPMLIASATDVIEEEGLCESVLPK